jgi:hypothetical protein
LPSLLQIMLLLGKACPERAGVPPDVLRAGPGHYDGGGGGRRRKSREGERKREESVHGEGKD